MSFSAPNQIQNSYDFLSQMETPQCPGCVRGIRMCYHTPCIGTVEDMEKIMDAGYSKNLMLDWWTGEDTKMKMAQQLAGSTKPTKWTNKSDNPFEEDVWYLAPAIVGSEGQKAQWNKTGVCNLLKDNQCSLHASGLKPIQGKMACCKMERLYQIAGEQIDLDERHLILHTWNSQRGRDLIERWKQEVSYGGNMAVGIPNSMQAITKAVAGMSASHASMYKNGNKDGRPDLDPNEKFDLTQVIYELPDIP